MSAKRSHVIAIVGALCAMLATPLARAADSRPKTLTETQSEIAKRLDRFESAAAALQKQTDRYASSIRTNQLQRLSHANQLNQAREQVNYLGRELSGLEQLSPQGTELQQMAIREARPHLEAVADHVQSAIVMLNEDKSSYWTAEFREKVKGMYEHADNLYLKVDSITDLEKTRSRAASLDALAES